LLSGCRHFCAEEPVQPAVAVVEQPRGVPIQRIFPTPPEELIALEQPTRAPTEPRPTDQTTSKVDVPETAVLQPLKEPPPVLQATPPAELSPLCQALQAYQADHPDEALELLSAYQPRDQEVLIRLLPVIAKVDKGGLLTEAFADEARLNLLEVFRSLTTELQTAAPLVIAKLAFCEDVKSFGRGELRTGNQFRAGDRAALYAELQNLTDQKAPDGRYVTRLASSLEIRQGDRLVRKLPVQSQPDWSWSPRHDHFSVIRFPIPRDLEPGAYTLTVRMADEDTGRSAEKHLGFRIISLSAAKGP
jgi:hypothetical protein